MPGHDAAPVQARRQAGLPYVIAGGLLTSLGGLLGFLPFAHLERWKSVVDFVQGMLFGVAMGLSIANGLILRKYLKD